MTVNKLRYLIAICAANLAHAAALPATDMATVVAKPVSRTIDLPSEILPFLSVSLHAKVPGFVERVLADRGSVVHDIEAEAGTGAGVRLEQAAQHADGGRLAGPIRPQKPEEGALGNIEIESIHGGFGSVELAQVPGANGKVHPAQSHGTKRA